MTSIDLTGFGDNLVLHFGVDRNEINAETLSNALLGLSNSIKCADSYINYGFDVELIIEALGRGSFKVSTRVFRRTLHNIFSEKNIKALVIGIISSAIWYHLQPNEKITITTNNDEYVVERGNERIILPKESEKYFDSIKNNIKIREEISKTFKALNNDDNIKNIEFHSIDKSNHQPDFKIEREKFAPLSRIIDNELETDSYEIDVTLMIVKAILEKSLRKWQFKLNNRPISSPILDFDFFNDFIAHKITIAPGDTLQVKLRVIREKNIELNILSKEYYEIIKVYKHNSKQ